jgi:hypothetical protein
LEAERQAKRAAGKKKVKALPTEPLDTEAGDAP